MNSNSINDSVCLQAVETNTNWRILTIMSSVIVMDISSILLLSIYLLCYSTNKALHLNLRALSTTITAALIIRNLLTCIRAFRMLVAGITVSQDPCSFLTPKVICSIESVINATPIQCASWGFVIVTIERIFATVFTEKYGKMKLYPLAIFCGLLPWVIFGYEMTLRIISAIHADSELMPYCSSLSSRMFDILETLNYQVAMASGTALVSLFIYFINKKAKKFEALSGAAHLTIRYQRLENIEATKVITVHTICFLAFYVQNLYVVYLISQLEIKELPEFAILKELSSLTFPIHGNLHVILALFLSKKLRQKFLSFWICFVEQGERLQN
ncbi:hypothetical protein FO519_006479 [Halicephalobus sp. NKZ332]|nr:hypothetical protein FO519_006479 [Halicephalobus sp. NKZ332]